MFTNPGQLLKKQKCFGFLPMEISLKGRISIIVCSNLLCTIRIVDELKELVYNSYFLYFSFPDIHNIHIHYLRSS